MTASSANSPASARLFGRLQSFAQRTALIDETERAVSYAELLALGDDLVRPLGEARRLVFIEIENKLAPIAAYVGALRAGHAVVLTGEGGAAPDARLAGIFQPEFAFVRAGEDWAFEARAAEPAVLHRDLAVMLSTSGSTGSPKLVRLSHKALLANAASIAEYLGFQAGERAITALPPSYSYGMSVINSHLETGQTLILSDESVTETAFWDRFHRHGATSFAGVPHTYELLEHTGFLASDHPSLRYFTQAGGKLAADKVRRFAEWATARGHRFFVMYGQTEAGPRMAYVPPKALAEHPDAIGVAVPGGTLSVEDGELIYRGPNVMMGYALERADLAGGPQLSELRTGDLASVDDNGFFRITGRASRFSKIFGLRIGLDEVEGILKQAGFEAVATGDDEGLVVATVNRGREAEAVGLLAGEIKLPASRIRVVAVDEIPRNASGKVDYPAVLRLRAAAPASEAKDLRGQLAEILGVDVIEDGDTFVDLGGDSLSYVQASLLLETHLGAVPEDWENKTIAELEQIAPEGQKRAASLEASVFVRAIAITLVVFNHVANLDFGGAATTLLIVTGLNFSRFQLPRLQRADSWGLLTSTMLRTALPYFAVISFYFAVTGSVFWPQYLLFGNFTEGYIFEGKRRFDIYWFIEIYLTLIVLLSALFLIPKVREVAKQRPRAVAAGVFALTAGMALAAKPYNHLQVFADHTPITFTYVFAFGWLIEKLKSLRARLGLVAVGAVALYVLRPDDVLIAIPVVAVAVLTLLFVKRVTVGAWMAKLLSAIAAASLYIYIFHGLILHSVRRLAGTDEDLVQWAIVPVSVLCIVFGVALTRAVEMANSKSGRAAIGHAVDTLLGRAARKAPSRPAGGQP